MENVALVLAEMQRLFIEMKSRQLIPYIITTIFFVVSFIGQDVLASGMYRKSGMKYKVQQKNTLLSK